MSFQPLLGPPALAAVRQANSLTISWPAVPASYILESASNVTGAYSAYPATPLETNGLRTVTVPLTESRRFFRLRRN